MNNINKFEVLLERIVKHVITELYHDDITNIEDMCKTDTEKTIDAMSKKSMPISNIQPINNPPQKRKVLVARKNHDKFPF